MIVLLHDPGLALLSLTEALLFDSKILWSTAEFTVNSMTTGSMAAKQAPVSTPSLVCCLLLTDAALCIMAEHLHFGLNCTKIFCLFQLQICKAKLWIQDFVKGFFILLYPDKP